MDVVQFHFISFWFHGFLSSLSVWFPVMALMALWNACSMLLSLSFPCMRVARTMPNLPACGPRDRRETPKPPTTKEEHQHHHAHQPHPPGYHAQPPSRTTRPDRSQWPACAQRTPPHPSSPLSSPARRPPTSQRAGSQRPPRGNLPRS